MLTDDLIDACIFSQMLAELDILLGHLAWQAMVVVRLLASQLFVQVGLEGYMRRMVTTVRLKAPLRLINIYYLYML